MKIWIIIALVLIIVGGVMFTASLAASGWDFTQLSTVKYETQTHEVTEPFTSVLINTSTADVNFVLSENGETKIVCYEAANRHHEVSVSDGELSVTEKDERRWVDHIGISIGSPKITVYLAEAELSGLTVKLSSGDVDIPADFSFGNVTVTASTGSVRSAASVDGCLRVKTDTGSVNVRDSSVGELDVTTATGKITLDKVSSSGGITLEVSTGKTAISDTTCKSLTSSGSTGDIEMDGVTVSGKMSITRSTGDVEFERCDAGEICIKTTTGDVEGELLTGKTFSVGSSTGKIEVPHSTTGGLCEIRTSTGDIEIDVTVTD